MSSESGLVTVVVPVYNSEKWIGRTLASATAQTYTSLDIVVVDDGSTDKSSAIVEAAAKSDSRIRLIRKQNGGVAAARNLGIAEARGDLIAPLDADDLWHPEKIARQVAVMRSSSQKVGLVYCWAVEIDEDDLIIPPVLNGPTADGSVLAEVVARAGIITSGSNPLIRRSCLEAIGGYDSSVEYCEDWKLQLSLAEICEWSAVPEFLVGYRRTTGSRSKNVAGTARSMESISRWIKGRWPDMPCEIERQMIYNRNAYLAHLSLTNDQLVRAAGYKLEGLKAWRQGLRSRDTVAFGIRLLARMAGIRRRPQKAKLSDFKGF